MKIHMDMDMDTDMYIDTDMDMQSYTDIIRISGRWTSPQ